MTLQRCRQGDQLWNMNKIARNPVRHCWIKLPLLYACSLLSPWNHWPPSLPLLDLVLKWPGTHAWKAFWQHWPPPKRWHRFSVSRHTIIYLAFYVIAIVTWAARDSTAVFASRPEQPDTLGGKIARTGHHITPKLTNHLDICLRKANKSYYSVLRKNVSWSIPLCQISIVRHQAMARLYSFLRLLRNVEIPAVDIEVTTLSAVVNDRALRWW